MSDITINIDDLRYCVDGSDVFEPASTTPLEIDQNINNEEKDAENKIPEGAVINIDRIPDVGNGTDGDDEEKVNQEIEHEGEVLELRQVTDEDVRAKNPTWKYSLIYLAQRELVRNNSAGWKGFFSDKAIVNLLNDAEEKIYERLNLVGFTIQFLPKDQTKIFRAFGTTPLENIKVVILGQDVYYSEDDQACGLAFSVEDGIRIPTALRNIFLEIGREHEGYVRPQNGDLTRWAEQGVFLYNCGLTVEMGTPEKHLRIWSDFSDRVIEYIGRKTSKVVFLLWGKFAKDKKSLISTKRGHLIIEAPHPSSRDGSWYGNGCFAKTNEFLKRNGKDPIVW